MGKYQNKISMLLSICTLIGVIGTCGFWFYETNELPKKVQDHETRIAALEKQMVENNTKTELIYQAILEVRRAVVYK